MAPGSAIPQTRAMILGLPIDAWLLLVLAVGLGLGLEIAFLLAHRRDGKSKR